MNFEELAALFLPHIQERIAPVAGGKRLVHYTSAEAAFRIISGREVWLRNAHLMNDYSEMKHGLACLQQAWVSPAGVKLQNWLDECWPGFRDEVMSTFDAHSDNLQNATYLISLSEHDDDEDLYGRLSMWRAYGSSGGVALVLNPQVFLSQTDAMSVYSTPVIYRDVADFVAWFDQWVDTLIAAQAALQASARADVLGTIFYAFRTFVLGTKHPGFREEKEWRVFHSPAVDGGSPWLRYDVEVVRGAPQHIVKVALRDDEEAGVKGADPKLLVNRVIIGPCESPLPVRDALGAALADTGAEDIGNKVWMSFIPIRQRQ